MIAALILAAGQSRRMGRPKMLLPWGQLTVIEHVITTFLGAGTQEVVVITGSAREQVEQATQSYPVRRIFNPDYASGEMLSSLQKGLREMAPEVEAVLVALGDQPQIRGATIRKLLDAYSHEPSSLIVPSFQKRRGHPWLVQRTLWDELLSMDSSRSPRDFLNAHAGEIHYVEIDNPSILADLDTPQDYEVSRP
jgi:molybdenum cofactor cytidylyltransferase